jgi:hypothetical protein
MSTELDPFFIALRHDADGLPTTTPDLVRRRGRQRRRRIALTASFAAFVVLLSVALVAGNRPDRKEQPAPPVPADTPTSTPIKFDTLVPVGPGIRLGGSESADMGLPVIVGNRAFVSWKTEDDNLTVIAAVELATGRKIWGPVELASFSAITTPLWHPRYAVVVGRNDNGSRPVRTVFVLDPDTGRMLLRVDVDKLGIDHVLLGESTLVVGARSDRTTRGYDLATGQVRWTIPDPPSGIARIVPMEHSPGPSIAWQRNRLVGAPYTVREFVQLTTDRAAIVRDIDTGRETARRSGAVVDINTAVAVDDVLYSVDEASRNRVQAVDLTGSDPARTVYTATPGVTVHLPTVCGTSRICVGEREESGGTYLVALDTIANTVRWRQAGQYEVLSIASGQVLMELDERSAIFDPSGRQLLNEQAQRASAMWIDDQAVLLVRYESVDASTRTVLLGVSPLDSDPVPLGTILDVRGCDTSRTHLVCITVNDIKVWRFAKQ